MDNHLRSIFLLSFIGLFWLLLNACNSEKNPETSATETRTATVQQADRNPVHVEQVPITDQTVTTTQTVAIQTPTNNLNTSRNTQYNIKAELDYTNHILNVEETINYFNNTTEPINDLLLMVEPAYYPNAFTLQSLVWEGGESIQDFSWEKTRIRIPLTKPLQQSEDISLEISYRLNLPSPETSPNIRPIPFGYTERQTNLVDWYPFIPPYIPGEGWLAHDAGYYGEHLAYAISDFDVAIKILDGNDSLVIAASSPAEMDAEWHTYRYDNARGFAWSISHQYQVYTENVGGVTVYSYAFPVHPEAGKAVLKTTAEALELYSRLYGPYPRSTISAVEADFLDGMEYDGMYFLSNGFYNLYQNTPGEYLIAIAAHETAHQWFYAQVGNDQALEPWLDEALCTYNERLFYENYHPEALDWWWNYRVFFYKPGGWVNDSIYNPHGATNAYRAYRDAVYLNGALFLEDIRLLIGDDSFFKFLKAYVEEYKYKLATGENFFLLLRSFTNEDIDPVINQYFSK
jgi:hypothetical protein